MYNIFRDPAVLKPFFMLVFFYSRAESCKVSMSVYNADKNSKLYGVYAMRVHVLCT